MNVLVPNTSCLSMTQLHPFIEKLGDLRNQWLMVFAISNTLWLILISTLANQGKLLNVFGSNLVGKNDTFTFETNLITARSCEI